MLIACFKHPYHESKVLPGDLAARGVKSAAVGDRLRTDAPAGAFTPEPPKPP